MVEPQPSKLMTWVRFPLPAPLCVFVEPLESIVTSEFKGNKKVNIISHI